MVFKKGQSGNPERVFNSENQPPGEKKSRKGIPNRATVYKKFLGLKKAVQSPTGGEIKVTLYEAAALGQLIAAENGNTRAWQEIQDSLHGKLKDEQEVKGVVEVILKHVKRKDRD